MISRMHAIAGVLSNTWDITAQVPCHTSHHLCGSIKVALAAFGLVFEDCFSQ